MYHGDINLGDTIDVKFTTVDATGAPTTLSGTPAVSAYVGNGTTQITAGITLSVDFDSVTGLNNVRVVASSGNGYATATNVTLVITTGTVDSVSVVGYEVGSFSIEARSALRPATAGRTLVVESDGVAHADVKELLGDAQSATDLKDFADAGYDPSTHEVQGVVLVDTTTVATDAESDIATLAAAVAALNDISATDVWAAATRTLTAGTNIVLAKGTGVTGFNDLDAAGVRTAVGLGSANLDAQLEAIFDNTVDIENAIAPVQGTVVDASATTTVFETALTEADDHWNDALIVFTSGTLAGVARPILDYAQTNGQITLEEALPSAPANGVSFTIQAAHVHPVSQIQSGLATAAKLVRYVSLLARSDAEAWSDLTTELAEINQDYGSGVGDYLNMFDAQEAFRDQLTGVGNDVDSILLDTAELQTDWADGGRLDLILDARASQASVDTIDDLLDTEIAALTSALAVVDGNVDSILLDTGTDGVVVASLGASALDAIHDEPITEPSSRPAWTSMTHRKLMQTLGVLMLNEVNSDSDSVNVRNDADSADLWAYGSADDGSIYTSGKAA